MELGAKAKAGGSGVLRSGSRLAAGVGMDRGRRRKEEDKVERYIFDLDPLFYIYGPKRSSDGYP